MDSYCLLPFFFFCSTIPACEILVPCWGMELMPPALEAQSPNPGPPGKSPYHMYVAFWGWLFSLNLFNLTFIHVVVAVVHSFLSLTHLPLYACMVVGYSSAEIFGLLFILAVCSLLYTTEVSSDSVQPHGLYLPNSPVCGIVLARILEWVVISSSRLSFPSFLTHGLTYGILILLPGIEPTLSAMESQSLIPGLWRSPRVVSCLGDICMTLL